MKRTLRLRRETFADLTTAELDAVDGAAASVPKLGCDPVTEPCTLGYQTCRACITHPPCTI